MDRELLVEHVAGTGSRQKLQSNRQSVDGLSKSDAHTRHHVSQNTNSLLDRQSNKHIQLLHAHLSFAVAGPTTWNSLAEYLRDPELSIDSFWRQLKTFLFAQY